MTEERIEELAKGWAIIIQPVDSAKQAEPYVAHLIRTVTDEAKREGVEAMRDMICDDWDGITAPCTLACRVTQQLLADSGEKG